MQKKKTPAMNRGHCDSYGLAAKRTALNAYIVCLSVPINTRYGTQRTMHDNCTHPSVTTRWRARYANLIGNQCNTCGRLVGKWIPHSIVRDRESLEDWVHGDGYAADMPISRDLFGGRP